MRADDVRSIPEEASSQPQMGNHPNKPHRVATENLLGYCITLLGHLRRLDEALQKVVTLHEMTYPIDNGQFDTEILISLSLIESAWKTNRNFDHEFMADPVAAPLAITLRAIAEEVVMRCEDPSCRWLVTKYPHDPASPPVQTTEPLFIVHLPNVIERLSEILVRADLPRLDAKARRMKLNLDRARLLNSERETQPVVDAGDAQNLQASSSESPVEPKATERNNPVADQPSTVTMGGSGSVEPQSSAPIVEQFEKQPWESHRDNRTLTGWKQILEHIGMTYDRSSRRRVDALNRMHFGPIYRPRKKTVYADAGALTWWWQSMAARAAAVNYQAPSLPMVKQKEVGHYEHEEGVRPKPPHAADDQDATPDRPY